MYIEHAHSSSSSNALLSKGTQILQLACCRTSLRDEGV